MAKRVKIKLQDNVARVVTLEEGATDGATLGTNLFLPDGSVASPTTLAAYLGLSGTSTGGIRDHRLLAGLALGDDHPQYTRKDTLTTRGDLYARGASTVGRLALGTNKQLLRSNGTDPAWATLSPTITLSTDLSGNTTLTDLENATLAATIVNNAVTDAKLRDSAAASVIGRSAATSGDPADIVSSADNQVVRRSSGIVGFGQITSAYVSDFTEAAQDAVGSLFVDSSEIDFTYDDPANTLTASLIAASVAFDKLQNISTSRILGRTTSGSGSIESLTGTQATTLLDTFTSSLQGLVPASGGGTANFLRADGAFAAPAGGVTGLANPTASVGLSAVNGSATTAMRSDGAPALDQGISPTWTAQHIYSLVGTSSQPTVLMASSKPILCFRETDAGTDAKNWYLEATGEQFVGTVHSDDFLSDSPWLRVNRSGAVVTSITFGNTTNNPAFELFGTGATSIAGPVTLTKQGSGATPTLKLSNNVPLFELDEADAASNQRLWQLFANGGQLTWRLLSDDRSTTTANFLLVSRSGTAVSDISLGNATDNPTITVLGTGNIKFGATTTGAQTATFTATNKPGSGTAGPIAWLPVLTAGGTQGYIPIFGA